MAAIVVCVAFLAGREQAAREQAHLAEWKEVRAIWIAIKETQAKERERRQGVAEANAEHQEAERQRALMEAAAREDSVRYDALGRVVGERM